MKVQDLMTSRVQCCSPNDTLDVPARLMWEHDVGIVPVVDAQRHLRGVLTDRDITMAALLRGKNLFELKVGDTMAKQVVTCAPGDSLVEAESRMRATQVRRLPVVDAVGHVRGVLSLNDLAQAVGGGRRAGVPAREVAETLADVCRPRVGAVAK